MSSSHRRANSTDPRPGSTNFPRMSICPPPRPPTERPAHTRMPSTESVRQPRPDTTRKNTGFPRMTMRPAAERTHVRMGSTDTRAPARRPSQAAPPPRPVIPRDDGATKMQMNQTLAIAMMASPINPLPFFLPIPLGVTMLVSPSNDRTGSAS